MTVEFAIQVGIIALTLEEIIENMKLEISDSAGSNCANEYAYAALFNPIIERFGKEEL